ncbi:hypothetical protein [Aeoliella sp. SH292]|uniref:hypothetical protein n=1 Tax=Aeoliella sp. SH292 TaxID=3454464 RepID=UPI003F995E62
MTKHPIDEPLMRLFDNVLSGEASATEVRRLEKLLADDEAVRTAFALVSQMDVDLRHAYRTGAMGPSLKSTRPSDRAPSPASLPSTRWWQWAMAIAAMVLVAVGLSWPSSTDTPVIVPLACVASKPPAPVATLSSLKNAEWEQKQLAVGHSIREGESLALKQGEVRISVGYGAEIAAQAPCSLTFISRDKVRLDYGDVTVHVAEWAKGYTVLTDTMEVVDLGTTFAVSAAKGAGAQTKVLKGLVRVHPKQADHATPKGVLVGEGRAFAVDEVGRPDSRKEFPVNLLSPVDMGYMNPYKPITVFNTGLGFREGDEDPNWRVVAGEGIDPEASNYAMVCTPDERYLPNDALSSQWVSTPSWRNSARNSVFTFRTEFSLKGYDLSTIQLFGRFLADNGIQEVRVNDQPIKVVPWTDNDNAQQFDHSKFRYVDVTEGLVQGINSIEVDVWNGIFQEPADARDKPNPMALRVEWYAFGRQTDQTN